MEHTQSKILSSTSSLKNKEAICTLLVSTIQISTLNDGCKQEIDQQLFNRKSISRKITDPQSWKLQAKLTGEKLKG